jgi:hypothetical protein
MKTKMIQVKTWQRRAQVSKLSATPQGCRPTTPHFVSLGVVSTQGCTHLILRLMGAGRGQIAATGTKWASSNDLQAPQP